MECKDTDLNVLDAQGALSSIFLEEEADLLADLNHRRLSAAN